MAMPEFEVSYLFNVRRVLKRTIEAATPEEAIEIAKRDAAEAIDAEVVALTSTIGWADTDKLEPHLFIDMADGTEIADQKLELPE